MQPKVRAERQALGCIFLATDIGRSYAAEDSNPGPDRGDWRGSLGGGAERSLGRACPSARPSPRSRRRAEPASPTATSPQVSANSSNTAAILEQLRAAEIDRELDQIRELQAAGADNPQTTGLLLGKVTHREPEVRKAALEALVQLNDTNAIPGLEQAASLIQDPREKVAVMDAVSYLKLPGVADGTSPELADASNYQASATSPRQVVPNPRFHLAQIGRRDDNPGWGRVPSSPSLQRTRAKRNRPQLRRILPRPPHPRRIPPHRSECARSDARNRGRSQGRAFCRRAQANRAISGLPAEARRATIPLEGIS